MKKKILLLLGFGTVLFGLFVFTFNFGKLALPSSLQEYYLDPQTFYSGKTFVLAIESLGESGRNTILALHKIDYVFILFLYPFLFLILWDDKLFRWMPIVAMCGDLLENILMDSSIHAYPETSLVIGTIAGVSTAIKTIFVYSAFLSILYLKVPKFKRKDRA